MTKTAMSGQEKIRSLSNKALTGSARFWFLIAVIGQLLFTYYMVVFYGGAALTVDADTVNNVLVHGIVPGDLIGNIAVVMHLLLAAIITFSGPLQIILGSVISDPGPLRRMPKIQSSARSIHRLNGRIYMLVAVTISIGGIYMIMTRGTIGGFSQHLAINLNGVLIIVFAAIALRYAMTGKIDKHRRWALRLFLMVSGVWFFRVGFMLWMLIHQRPVGFDIGTFTGPFLIFLAFAQHLLPLAVLELYFYTKDRAGTLGRFVMAVVLIVLTFLTGIGIFGALVGMWLPLL